MRQTSNVLDLVIDFKIDECDHLGHIPSVLVISMKKESGKRDYAIEYDGEITEGKLHIKGIFLWR